MTQMRHVLIGFCRSLRSHVGANAATGNRSRPRPRRQPRRRRMPNRPLLLRRRRLQPHRPPQRRKRPSPPRRRKPLQPLPVPSGETVFTGWIDFGYRWRSDVGGNLDLIPQLGQPGIGSQAHWNGIHVDRSETPALRPAPRCAPMIGATTLTLRSTSMPARPRFTTSAPTTADIAYFDICRRTPTRC